MYWSMIELIDYLIYTLRVGVYWLGYDTFGELILYLLSGTTSDT